MTMLVKRGVLGAMPWLFLFLTGCGAIAPAHDIPVSRDHIHAVVQPGDRIDVITRSGERESMVVKSVENDALVGEHKTYRFSELSQISKRSFEPPKHPCEGPQPPGCSIPALLTTFSDFADDYADKFHGACVTHDFCNAHGFATYGADRDECDQNFLANMRLECKGVAGLGVLDVEEFAECQLVAQQIYDTVRLYGEPHYRLADSAYCEYR